MQKTGERPGASGASFEHPERLSFEAEPASEVDGMRMYLNSIGQVALLNAEQEVTLAQDIEAGLLARELVPFTDPDLPAAEAHDLLDDWAYRYAVATHVRQATSLAEKKRAFTPGEPELQAARRSTLGLLSRVIPPPPRTPEAVSAYREQMAKLRQDLGVMSVKGERSRKHFIDANLRLVVTLAKRHRSARVVPLLDVIQYGNVGLIHAVEMFDHTRGFKFSTYAAWWINAEIERGTRNETRTIQLPKDVIDSLSRMRNHEEKLTAALGHSPTLDELATAAKMQPDDILYLRSLPQSTASFDAPVGEDGMELEGVIPSRAAFDPQTLVGVKIQERSVRDAFYSLTPPEQTVLSRMHGIYDRKQNVRDIAKALGLKQEKVEAIGQAAVAHMQAALSDKLPGDTLSLCA